MFDMCVKWDTDLLDDLYARDYFDCLGRSQSQVG